MYLRKMVISPVNSVKSSMFILQELTCEKTVSTAETEKYQVPRADIAPITNSIRARLSRIYVNVAPIFYIPIRLQTTSTPTAYRSTPTNINPIAIALIQSCDAMVPVT